MTTIEIAEKARVEAHAEYEWANGVSMDEFIKQRNLHAMHAAFLAFADAEPSRAMQDAAEFDSPDLYHYADVTQNCKAYIRTAANEEPTL